MGDRVNVLVPSVSASLTGMLPRTKQFIVSGIFSIGAPELDDSFAYMSLKNSSKLLKMKGFVHGVRVSYQDLFSAPIEIKKDLSGIVQVVRYDMEYSVHLPLRGSI